MFPELAPEIRVHRLRPKLCNIFAEFIPEYVIREGASRHSDDTEMCGQKVIRSKVVKRG